MLTLSRKPGQSIVIGNDIIITVKELRGKNVRISIEAPKGYPIYREELHREIVEENRRAAMVVNGVDDSVLDSVEFDNVISGDKG
ncbi:MAG: carbon storage regulator [Deltaproteobacteria bacterium]|nr:carbon storage regulator [Deltaproteobacteria bacterium]